MARRSVLRSLRVLISSGPTREPLDPVRFISNYSTGYMGAQLAATALARGHQVTVISGPGTETLPRGARVIRVEQAAQMEAALRRRARQADVIIMAAAVADFRAARPARRKLARKARGAGSRTLALEPTPDIVARLPRRPGQVVVGFALETDRVLARARRKLRAKRLDLVLAQDASRRAPFGRLPVRAWLLEPGGAAHPLGVAAKSRVARALLDKIEGLWYGQIHSG